MKGSLIIFVVACVLAVHADLTDEQKEKIRVEVHQCAAENGVSQQILDDIKDGKHIPPSRELDCFSACILKKNGVMKEDGTVNHKPTDSDAAKTCKESTGKDACELAGKIMECYAKSGLLPQF